MVVLWISAQPVGGAAVALVMPNLHQSALGTPWQPMHSNAARLPFRIAAASLLALAIALACAVPAESAQQSKGHQAAVKEDGEEAPVKGGQTIAVLVNDEPITAYEIEQRALYLSLNSGGGENMQAKLEARWQQLIKEPKINERFQQLLRERNVKTKEEAMALQKDYVMGLQRNLLEQVKRETRVGRIPQFRQNAREELIDERLKVQEAKRLGIEVSEEDAKRVLREIAARNKMTEEQFAQQVKSQGVDIATMRDKFKAQGAWREAVRRRFSAQISITEGEIDRMVSAAATERGEDAVELQLQKITLSISGGIDQALLTKRFTDAEALRKRYAGCKSLAELAKSAGARFDDLQYLRPSSIPEPTRSLLLNAKDGELLPPATTPSGIEMYAVCGRRSLKADDKQREKAHNDLAQQEFEIMAKRLLRDLRQDAHIEYR